MPADPAQSRSAALFDQAESHGGRRRRPAPDWGGDDLFDHVPRRRFAPSTEDRRRSGPEPAHAASRASRASAAIEVPVPAPVQRPEPVEELVRARRAEYETMSPPPAGRRTVTVTGRPGHGLVAHQPRPGRSVEHRIGARPDQLAAWAVALGLLLILVAVATSG